MSSLGRVVFGALMIVVTMSSASAADEVKSLVAGDAKTGESIAGQCSACHGAKGHSSVPSFPKLAGQNARYLVKQMQDMKSGARQVPEMVGITQSLSDKDILNLASYFSSQKPTYEVAKPDLVEAGQSIFRGGIAETKVVACIACHGPAGEGVAAAGFPALAGQHAAYIESQLLAYRNAARGDKSGKKRDNDGTASIMRSVAEGLTDDDIKSISSYLSGLQ